MRSKTAILGALVLTSSGCVANQHLLAVNVERPDTPSISRPLAAFLVRATQADSLGNASIHAVELLHARYLACADDQQLTPYELDVINHAWIIGGRAAALTGEEPPTRVSGPPPDARSAASRTAAGVTITLRPGPCIPDPTEASPAPLFAPSPVREGIRQILGGDFRSHPAPTPPFRDGAGVASTSAWRLVFEGEGVAYLYDVVFDSGALAHGYARRMSSAPTLRDLDWRTICGDCAATFRRSTAVRRFVGAAEPTGDGEPRRVFVLLAPEELTTDPRVAALERLTDREIEADAATARAGERRPHPPGWPPPVRWEAAESGLANALIQRPSDLVALADREPDAAIKSMLLILAAQLGDADAARALPARLRAGHGLVAPAPDLADAWERRRPHDGE